MATKPKAILSTMDNREASPITKASNVLFENGQTAQDILNDRQDAMISPVIENSSSMFKVGQGDNVDYSANVVNGAYESMVLKGKSMVNCIQESSSQDVVLPYEFEEGQYVTINDTKESGALGVELKGQTLVNLNKMVYPVTSWGTNVDNNNYYRDDYTLASGMIKPSTKYLFKVYGLSNIHEVILQGTSATTFVDSNGRYRFDSEGNLILTSTENIHEYPQFVPHFKRDTVNNLTTEEMNSLKMIILEYQEGMENWDIPCFEGMTSCKMPILHTVGKNLIDYKNYNLKANAGQNPQEIIIGEDQLSFNVNKASWVSLWYDLYLESGEKYTLSYNTNLLKCFIFQSKVNTYVNSELVTSATIIDATEDKIQKVKKTFTAPSTGFIRIRLTSEQKTGNHTLQNFQIEKGTTATTYEPYKSSILSLPEEVVLGGLGNTRDTFNTTTGKYTKRTDTMTVTNYKNSLGSSVVEGAWSIVVAPPNKKWQTTTLCVSDKFSMGGGHSNRDCGFYENPANFVFFDKTVNSADEFIAKYGDFSFTYILETPIVTKINLPSTLKSWDTTTHIYSEIPENTLYPILSHSNPSYPVILKPSTKYSIVANSCSNSHTNSAINFNLGGATASTTVGNRVTTITTPSTLTSEELVMSGRGNKLNNVMVIEGDVVGDEPYFEGICDCKSPILSNVGKNLWNIPSKAFDGKNYTVPSGNGYYGCKIMTLPRGTYFVKATLKNNDIVDDYMYFGITNFSTNNNGNHSFNVFYATGKGYNTNITNGFKIKITSDFQDIYLWSTSRASSSIQRVLNCLDEVHMELTNEEDVVYESYKSNTTTFNQKDGKTIVLRSLPNGVCDTLNIETGEYVQRIGEVVLDGTKRFGRNMPESEYNKPCVRVSCGDLLVGGVDAPHFNLKADGIAIGGTSYTINYPVMAALHQQALYIYMPRTKIGLDTTDNDATSIANKFNDWLSQNHITVQYELATPIILTIDVQGFPYAYTNGHVQLSSGHSGQSLTPKVEYSVATNRNGQIRSNQKMVERHQKQLDQLQAIILANLVNSQYNQTLTTLKYELSRV